MLRFLFSLALSPNSIGDWQQSVLSGQVVEVKQLVVRLVAGAEVENQVPKNSEIARDYSVAKKSITVPVLCLLEYHGTGTGTLLLRSL